MASTNPTKPLGQEILVLPHVKNNGEVLSHNRIFFSLIAGCLAGIAGITGYKGFGVYAVAHAVLSLALLAKTGMTPKKYFPSWSAVLVGGTSSTELLTFILFWTLSNNLVYLF